MDDPGKKDKSRVGLKKWGLIGLIVLLFLLCLGSMIWCLWLPRFLEQTLLPQLARQYGIAIDAADFSYFIWLSRIAVYIR